MDVTLESAGAPAVVGVTDNRSVTLDRLAGDALTAAENLQHVLPADETVRVAVAAFGSSI